MVRVKRNSLPWSLGAMRRDEQPGPCQRVVPPMRDVVKDLVRHLCRTVYLSSRYKYLQQR